MSHEINPWIAEQNAAADEIIAKILAEESLKNWVTKHTGKSMTLELAATVPACLGYYPVVTADDGTVTGQIADADDPAYSLYRGDDRFCSVVRD